MNMHPSGMQASQRVSVGGKKKMTFTYRHLSHSLRSYFLGYTLKCKLTYYYGDMFIIYTHSNIHTHTQHTHILGFKCSKNFYC